MNVYLTKDELIWDALESACHSYGRDHGNDKIEVERVFDILRKFNINVIDLLIKHGYTGEGVI